MLTQPGRTSLDTDLQLLARHAAPADRDVYEKCLKMYREVCTAPCRGLAMMPQCSSVLLLNPAANAPWDSAVVSTAQGLLLCPEML